MKLFLKLYLIILNFRLKRVITKIFLKTTIIILLKIMKFENSRFKLSIDFLEWSVRCKKEILPNSPVTFSFLLNHEMAPAQSVEVTRAL
jgi:hypothetical protein